jgi:hypothetical protein
MNSAPCSRATCACTPSACSATAKRWQKPSQLRAVAPPVPLDTAVLGLQVLLEGLVNQWLLDPAGFDLVQAGSTTLDVYLAGLGLPRKPTPATAPAPAMPALKDARA